MVTTHRIASVLQSERMRRMHALRAAFAGGAPDTVALADEAWRLSDHRLLLSLCSNDDASRALGDNLDALRALCCLHLGEPAHALESALRACLRFPEDRRTLELTRLLRRLQNQAQMLGLPACIRSSGEPIRLTPLDAMHCEEFRLLYDSMTAELCCLPEFEDDDHWLHWVHEQRTHGRRTFSVIHDDWGMVGSVSLRVLRGVGLFYYWIGADFRGQGFGPAAVELLLDHAAEHWGMYACFAKVYADNLSSLRALRKLGFYRLPTTARPPHDDQIFLRSGPAQPDCDSRNELDQLLDDLDSEVVLDGIISIPT